MAEWGWIARRERVWLVGLTFDHFARAFWQSRAWRENGLGVWERVIVVSLCVSAALRHSPTLPATVSL